LWFLLVGCDPFVTNIADFLVFLDPSHLEKKYAQVVKLDSISTGKVIETTTVPASWLNPWIGRPEKNRCYRYIRTNLNTSAVSFLKGTSGHL